MKAFFKFGQEIVGKIFPPQKPQESVGQELLEPSRSLLPDRSTSPSFSVDGSTKVSAHFTLGEMCKSSTAERLGIINLPNEIEFKRLTTVAEKILEPVRVHFDRPFAPNSGFRCNELNTVIGSKPSSQHCLGQAVDFEIVGISNEEVARWVKNNLDFDQLILEFYDGEDPNSGWIHVSYVAEDLNRNQALVYYGKSYALFE
jgi:hypothetical protein